MSNERSRDFGGGPSHGSDQGRDPGAQALLELARLIGGQNDPFQASRADAPHSDSRLSDVSRAAASRADFGARPADRGASGRREPDLGEPDLDDARGRRQARGGDFDFPEPPADDFAEPPRRAAAPAYKRRRDEYPEEYAEGGEYGEPEEFEDEETPRRRPTRVIMAVLGLAVFGSAAAYGYRTLVAADPSGPPPIIKADNSPRKITPMTDVRADSGRTGDRIGERIVRRDEDPVDIGASDAAPSVAFPGDPKRVHTVPIRADQGTASSPDRPAPRVAAPQAAPLTPPPAPAPQAPPPSPPRQAAAVQPPPQPAPPPPQPRQVAALASPPIETAASAESGGYVVQLYAVRSEADAQAEFRRLQTKYSVLSGRQPLIRRKDQGERGIFFAAQVGPFGARSEADQLCSDLKAAGGSCMVQRN